MSLKGSLKDGGKYKNECSTGERDRAKHDLGRALVFVFFDHFSKNEFGRFFKDTPHLLSHTMSFIRQCQESLID